MLDKRDIRRAFNKAAESYDEVAVLQRQVADELLERLGLVKQSFGAILDVGCGTGYSLPKLYAHYPKATLYALDLAEHMLTQAQKYWTSTDFVESEMENRTSTDFEQVNIGQPQNGLSSPQTEFQEGKSQKGTSKNFAQNWATTNWVKKWMSSNRRLWNKRQPPLYMCGDMESLGMRDESVDLIYSNLSLQWCNDLDTVFREWQRVLKPGGMLMFSSLGPSTLQELRHSWAAVDAREHVHSFEDMHNVGDALLHTGFAEPVMDVTNYTLTYATVMDLMRDLKTLGASNASDHKPRQLTGKSRVKQLAGHYEKFRQDGRLPASYEVVFGHAWKAITKPRQVEVAFPGKQPGAR